MVIAGFKYIGEVFDWLVTSRFPLVLLAFMTLVVIPIPLAYIFGPQMYTNKPFSSTFIPEWHLFNNMLLVTHITFSVPPLFFGPLLFIPAYRKKYPTHHRFMGKLYVIGCIMGGITVLPLAMNNAVGIEPRIGFSVMGVLWAMITWFAYTSARRKDFVSHRRWMMRSYAMTFAFVHVNLTYKLFGVYSVFGLDAVGVKIFQSMVSWMANLLLVELYLAATAVNGRWLGFKKWAYNLSHISKADKFYWTSVKPRRRAEEQKVKV